jgi:hypothetical protein
MSIDIRWLVPVAIYAMAPQCIAPKYMSVDEARALIFPFANEFVAKPVQLTPEQMQEIDKRSGVEGRSPTQSVWQALAKGKPMG